jgi:tetratricopeptide (TPR) repeat protein
MQIKSEISFYGSRVNKTLQCFIITLSLLMGFHLASLSATLTSLKVETNNIVLSASGLQKVSLVGNETTSLIIILPDTRIEDIYAYDGVLLAEQLKKSVRGIRSIEVVQYSLEPPEARIIVKSYSPLSPEIRQEDENKKVVISFKGDTPNFIGPFTTEAPDLKSKINCLSLATVMNESDIEALENAVSLKISGDSAQSIEELTRIYTENPANLWAGYKLSMLYIQKAELGKAEEINNKILQVNSDFFASYYALGIIKDMKGEIEAAIKNYSKANELFPEYQESHYRLGLLYLKELNLEGAEKQFKRTLEISPEHAGALQNLGLVLLKLSKLDEARGYFKQSLRTDALNNLGNIYLKENQPAEAIRYFSIALELDPKNALINYNIASAYQATEDFEEAMAYYERALELDPGLFNAHYNIAVLYAHSGENSKAVDAFSAYLNLNPESTDAEDIKALITQLQSE